MQNYVTNKLKTLKVIIKNPRRTGCNRAGLGNLLRLDGRIKNYFLIIWPQN